VRIAVNHGAAAATAAATDSDNWLKAVGIPGDHHWSRQQGPLPGRIVST